MLTRYRQATLLAVLVTIIMLGLTSAYWYKGYQDTQERRLSVFNDSADRIESIIHQRLRRFEIALRGVKGLVEASEFLNKQEYRNYINALELDKNLLGFQGLAVAYYVPHDAKNRHFQEMRQRGFDHYVIQPSGDRDLYIPLSLIEPYSGSNQLAIGYDLYSNTVIKPSLMQSRDTGLMVLSQKVTLIQDQGTNNPAAVMYMPIYDLRLPQTTTEERRKAIIGWVSGPFRIDHFIASLKQQLDQDIAIELFEDATTSTDSWLYGAAIEHTNLRTQRTINVGGREWSLVLHALPSFDIRFAVNTQQQMIAGGVVLSFLLGFLFWLLGTGRARAELLANKMTQELSATKTDLECTLNAMPDILFELDLEGRYHHLHTSQHALLITPPNELLGKKISDVLTESAASICLSALHEANQTGLSLGKKIEISIGEQTHWFELSVAKKDNTSTDQPRFIMISRDITERQLADAQLRIAAVAFESQEGMVVTDPNSKILRVNKAFTKITGYSADEAIGQHIKLLKSGQHDQHFYASMWDRIHQQGFWSGEVWNKRKNGEIYPQHLTITAVKNSNAVVTHYVATLTDITETKAALDEINLLAFYDPLTRLPNRRLLIDRLNHALVSSARNKQKGALLFLDLDHFKTLNDTLGHDTGDLLLQQVAHRLTACLREADTVARLGGDEFVVLLEGLGDQGLDAATFVEIVANKILLSISHTYQLGIHQCDTTVSIGATLFDETQTTIDDLLKQADIAMYESKNAGRNTMRFFDPKMQCEITLRADLEQKLRLAIAKNQLMLHYQVQQDSTGCAIGAEVLIRWMHPERGIISPMDFIPVAEDTGLIVPIGQWVLESACAQLKEWENHKHTCHLKLSVNVSARQFREPYFVQQVQSTIARYAIDSSLLNFELTESMLLKDIHSMIANMNLLKATGIQFVLDDFGTGYSSLQYLKQLPLYQLKIDRSFVRELEYDVNDRILVSTIISMANSLGLEVIAEGVENETQLTILKKLGCNRYQGYYFSKPLPIAQFDALLLTFI